MPKMPFTPRTRILNFRLTPDEYDQLRSACASQGMRCLSDFARAAVLRVAESAMFDPSVQRCLLSLDQKLSQLDANLVHIIRVLEADEPLSSRKRPTRSSDT